MSLRKPALLATTPDAPNKADEVESTLPIRTNRDFQILFVASIVKISVIDLYVFLKKKSISRKN